ncbi:hypothetical protein [Mycolicibacterium austroafricanum]|uniref:hypothetical protein n=1 Tax=Mycolicibacterium austroafricanum TaxID=39687 RepID=UPI001CA32D01|nr:hypothetical protein [Mycolicibacterium austroafricanum]QZT60573.1 hypothetical protein JN085_16090 [Mycolicibacterium austroafricanum]
MRQLDSAPPPPNWRPNLTAWTWFGVVVFVVGALYCVVRAATSVAQGSTLGALIAGGLAVMCVGGLAAFAVTFTVSAAHYRESVDSATTLRVNPAIAVLYGIALAGAVLGSSLYVTFSTRESVRVLFGGGVVFRSLMAALLALSLLGLIGLVRSREPGRLSLTPAGVEHANLLGSRSAVWDQITDIADAAGNRAMNPIVITVRDAKPIVVSNADRYGDGGPAVYWMVRHYWSHPDDRDELTDGRALARLREGQFPGH